MAPQGTGLPNCGGGICVTNTRHPKWPHEAAGNRMRQTVHQRTVNNGRPAYCSWQLAAGA